MAARAIAAEFLGTFAIVLATCGAYLNGAPPAGAAGIALGIGLAVLAMTAALGHISGGHFNPAVTVGMVAAGRAESARLVGYIIAQVLGAIAAVWLLQAIVGGFLSAAPRRDVPHAVFQAAANSYSEARGISLASALAAEVVATGLLVLVIVCVGARKAIAGLAPLAAGAATAALTLALLPITNAALSPARATAVAMLAGGAAMSQLWLFWVAPIVGGILGGATARWLVDEEE